MRIIVLVVVTGLHLLFSSRLDAQQSVGIGTTTPNPNAALDIQSTTRGVLIPTLTTAQQNALAAMLTTSEAGMLVVDATTGKLVCWSGTVFQPEATKTRPTAKAPLQLTANNLSLNPGTNAGDLLTWDGNNWVNKQPAGAHFTDVIDNHQPFLVMNYCISLFGIYPTQNTPFVGEISLMACNFPPAGWALCNGQLMPISENEVLFNLIGTTYGGDGQTTFALPDLQGRAPIHQGTLQGGQTYTIGQALGTEQKTFSR